MFSKGWQLGERLGKQVNSQVSKSSSPLDCQSHDFRFLEWLNPLFAALLILFALTLFGEKVLATRHLNSDPNQYVIVSSRDATEDIAYSLASSDLNGIKYVRADSALGMGIASSSGENFGVHSVNIALFRNHSFVRLLPQGPGSAAVQNRISAVEKSNWSMWAAFAVMIGTGVGLLFSAKREWVGPISAALALTALIQSVVTCSTCAHAMIWGVNAAFIGICFFGLASWASLKVKELVYQRLIALILGIVPFWQVRESLGVEFCVPCGLIALFTAWIFASSVSWSAKEATVTSPVTHSIVKRGAVWVAFSLVPMIAVVSSKAVFAAGESTHALFPLHEIQIKSILALGLRPPRHREVIFVAKKGCTPCESGIRAIDSIPQNGLTFAYVGDFAPDTTHPWTRIPNYSQVSSTPTLLFVDANGNVNKQLFGLPSDLTAIGMEIRNAKQFLSSLSALADKGKSNE